MTTYTIRTSDDALTTARTLEDLGTLDHVRVEHADAALGAYRELSPYDLEGASDVDTSGYTATAREAARLCQVIAEDIGA